MLDAPEISAPPRKSRPYIFYGETTSLCDQCLMLVPAKIQFSEGKVWYEKRCRTHGVQKALISTDIPFYKWQREFLKPGDRPLELQTQIGRASCRERV